MIKILNNITYKYKFYTSDASSIKLLYVLFFLLKKIKISSLQYSVFFKRIYNLALLKSPFVFKKPKTHYKVDSQIFIVSSLLYYKFYFNLNFKVKYLAHKFKRIF